MPSVFVHGNPETATIWEPLFAELRGLGRDDLVALSPPGFGAPLPAGFDPVSDSYRDWLLGELAAIDGPIDLVGHDWGGGHVMRAIAADPTAVRSWCTDIAGCMAPGYVWHDMALAWQSPDGEAAIAQMLGAPAERRAGLYEANGFTPEQALAIANGFDAAMGECVVRLYRSAAQPAMEQWGRELDAARVTPGLVLVPTDDPFTGGPALARQTAEYAGARVVELIGLGHWWMGQDPARGAVALHEFWSSLR